MHLIYLLHHFPHCHFLLSINSKLRVTLPFVSVPPFVKSAQPLLGVVLFCVSHTYCSVLIFTALPPVSLTVTVVLAVFILLAPFVPYATVGAILSMVDIIILV